MTKILTIAVVFFGALFILSPFGAYGLGEEFAIVTDEAVILDLAGDVKTKLGVSGSWIDAQVGMVLHSAGEIKTGPGSWAEIGFEMGIGNENVIRIKENSAVQIAQIKPVSLSLMSGQIRSLVQNLPAGSTFEIKTPTAVCGARGTGWDTGTDGSRVTVETFEREVYFYPVSGEGEAVEDPIIGAGKSGLLEGPGVPITIGDLAPGKMDDWNAWKEDMSNRTGIKIGIEGKVDKLDMGGNTIEDMMRGKESGALENKDRDSIRDRLDHGSDEGDSEPEYPETEG